MKSYIVSILIFFSLSVSLLSGKGYTVVSGQSYSNETTEMDKIMWVSVNPFMFLLGGYGGAVGFFRDDGNSEVVFPVYSLTVDDNSVIFGADSLLSPGERFYLLSVGVKARKYTEKNARGRGLYIGGKYNWSYISATRVPENLDGTYEGNNETISMNFNTFGLEVGFRRITKIGLTIAPRVGYDLNMVKADESSAVSDAADIFGPTSKGAPTLGLEIGWAF